MTRQNPNRRRFLKQTSATVAAAALAPSWHVAPTEATAQSRSPNQRIGIGAIGLRYQGSVITEKAQAHGNIVALCDIDRNVREQARAAFGSTPKIFEQYQDLLKRSDVDVVLIGTPDHWHAPMVVDACRAGKDVYVEKPLTLTIDEGKLIRKVAKETGRVVQVGSWQRSDHRFRQAVEMVRQGRIGKLQRVDVVLGKNKTGGPFSKRTPPGNLNWDLWQGQTPDVPYLEERSHYTFRWWYEYSGGQMTDWGAHHVDIAQWAIDSNPTEVEATAKYPTVKNGYNVAIDFQAKYKFANGVEMTIADHGRNGILFTGTQGRMFVNRGTISGKPVEDLASRPLDRKDFRVYPFDNLSRPTRMGKLDAIVNHMGNFFDCVKLRKTPISSVESQHRSVSTCHLGNIAMHIGQRLKWDPDSESFLGNHEANQLLRRDQRQGFEFG